MGHCRAEGGASLSPAGHTGDECIPEDLGWSVGREGGEDAWLNTPAPNIGLVCGLSGSESGCPPGGYKRPHAGTHAPHEKCQVRRGGADAHLAAISVHLQVRMRSVRIARLGLAGQMPTWQLVHMQVRMRPVRIARLGLAGRMPTWQLIHMQVRMHRVRRAR